MFIYSQPYTYLVGWSKIGKFYYGARWALGCAPTDLWKTYFTSSKRVAEFRKIYGEPDIVQVRKVFKDPNSAKLYEHKVLRRMKVRKRDDFLNITYGLCPSTTGLKMPPVSEETRRKQSLAKLGKKMPPRSDEHKRKLSEIQKGKKKGPYGPRKTPRTKEHCMKISQAKRGVKFGSYSLKTEERKAELKARRQELGPIVIKRITCPHCQKVGGASAMYRWHFDNCVSIKNNLGKSSMLSNDQVSV